jgi:hypothetical protein
MLLSGSLAADPEIASKASICVILSAISFALFDIL